MKHRIVYVSSSTLPSSEANSVHVAQMCDAFASAGLEVTLRARRGTGVAVREHYDLRQSFHIQFVNPVQNLLWLAGRRLNRGRKLSPGTLYFGRNLASLSRLAAWGYPVGFELHHPPRSDRKLAALKRIIEAPRFLGLVVTTDSLRVHLLAQFPELPPDRLMVAHDGVRADRILEPSLRDSDPVRAVYCGSFHQGKGVETLVAAAALVPHVQFDVIGGQTAQIEAIQSQATPNVRFLGAMSYEDTQQRLPQYDIALAPYGSVVRGVRTPKHESLAPWMSPLKLFEYMGAGLPIVTSDLPVLKEILQDGVTALMPPPDDPSGHAAAIRTLATDGDLRLRLARSAQSHLRAYTWENRAARILEFLKAGLRPI